MALRAAKTDSPLVQKRKLAMARSSFTVATIKKANAPA
jgi:hypothetical protein